MVIANIKTLKTIDYFGQLLCLSVAIVIISILGFTAHSDAPVFTAMVYSVSIVLSAQLLSCILNFFLLPKAYRYKSRYIYELVFLLFATMFIIQLFVNVALLNILGYFFYFSPLLSFSYLAVCYNEYKRMGIQE
jgi:hypothetical protein